MTPLLTQEQKVQELLRPRYKVIALFPGSKRMVGDIVEFQDLPGWPTKEYYEDFPHLFRKLEWYQERRIEDMPYYLKRKGEVVKVDQQFKMENLNDPDKPYDQWSHFISNGKSSNYIFWNPATEAEYTTYLSSLNNASPGEPGAPN